MQEKPEKCEVCITLTDEKKSGIIFSKLGDDNKSMLFKGRKRCWIMYETVKVIRLSDMDEVKDFVRAAGGCDFDIDVFYNRVIIDAKSILGVLSLDFSKVLTVQCADRDEEFEKTLEKYCA